MDKQNIIIDDDVSPASLKPKTLLTWNEDIIAKDCYINLNKITFEESNGSFRFCRSNEEYNTGRHNFKIKIEKQGKENGEQKDISIGVSWNSTQIMDAGIYYFSDSHIYCSYYPTINHGFTQLYTTPPKCVEGDTVEIIVDFDNTTIEFIINENSIFSTKLCNNNKPLFLVAGMFSGILEFI